MEETNKNDEKYIYFSQALKKASLEEIQDAIAEAVGKMINKNVACSISKIEIDFIRGASLSITLKEVL